MQNPKSRRKQKPVSEKIKDEPVIPTPPVEMPTPKQPVQPIQEQPVSVQQKPKKAAQRQSVDLDAIYNNAQPFPDWAEVVNNMKPVSRAIAAAFANSAALHKRKIFAD